MSLLDNLVSYFKLDEASGNALDAHGSNALTEHGTIGSATGKIGTARDFEIDDLTDWFSHTDNTDLSTGDIDFTFQAWIKIESIASTGTIICKGNNLGDDTATDYALYVNTSNEIHFRVGKSGSGFGDVAWSSTLSTGVWYHVICWHDSVNNQVGIAVDAGTAVTTSWSAGGNDTGNDFRIGNDDAAASRLYDGLIDEVGFWKRVLTADERTSLYNGGSGFAYPFLTGTPWNATFGLRRKRRRHLSHVF